MALHDFTKRRTDGAQAALSYNLAIPFRKPRMPTWDAPSPFTLALVPQAGDIDGLDHTNNAIYVQWCEQAGWSHSHQLGLSIGDYRRLDRAMAIRGAAYDYLLPTFEGEALTLGTWLDGGDGKLSMRRTFQLVRDSDGVTVMRGHWDLVCIEISTGKPKRMPAEFLAAYVGQT